MDEQTTDLNQENVNVPDNNIKPEDSPIIESARDQQYVVPVRTSDPVQQPENYAATAPEPVRNDFQNRQEILNSTDIKKPKKSKKKFLIFVIILVLLIVGGVVVYFVLNQKSDSKTSNETTTNKVVKTNTPKTVFMPIDAVKAVKKEITAKYPGVVSPDAILASDQIAFRTSDTAPYWKIADEKFYVNYIGEGASNLGVYFVGQSSKQTAAIAESLINQGFVLATGNAYDDAMSSLKAYTKEDVICTANNGEANSLAQLNCGQLSKYSKTLKSYISVKEFADAYIAGGGTVAEGSIFSGIEISDSQTIGYKTAELGLGNAIGAPGGAIGLFYKKGDESWRFFVGTQSAIACSEYKTVDLVNAFKGSQCYDSTKTGSESKSYVH